MALVEFETFRANPLELASFRTNLDLTAPINANDVYIDAVLVAQDKFWTAVGDIPQRPYHDAAGIVTADAAVFSYEELADRPYLELV